MASGEDHDLVPLPVRAIRAAGAPPDPERAPPRRVPPATVLVAAAALLAGTMTAVAARLSDGPPHVSGAAPRILNAPEETAAWAWTGSAGEGDEVAPAGWRRGMSGPLRPRDGHAAVWTGSELVVWGGDPEGDGGAYDPRRDRWRRIPPAPFPPPHSFASAWTGREVVVWGGRRADGPVAAGAAYDPVGDRWRVVARAPLVPRAPLAGVWTGRELVVVGGAPDAGEWLTDGAAYDPVADRWRAIAPMPFALEEAVGLWTGREVVVFGERVAAWDPAADRWRELPPPPLAPGGTTAVWTGADIMAWDFELHAAALSPYSAAGWRSLPDLPVEFADCEPEGTMAGRVVFAEHCGQGAIYRLSTRRWTRVTHPHQLSAAPRWTGRDLLFWVGSFVGSQDGVWRFRPPGPRPLGPVPPLRAPAG